MSESLEYNPNSTVTLFLKSGSFRRFKVIDDYNRKSLAIEVDSSLSLQRIIRVLDRIAEQRGYPNRQRARISVACSRAVRAEQHCITLDFIKSGKPTPNTHFERFNRTYRNEVLDYYLFNGLTKVGE